MRILLVEDEPKVSGFVHADWLPNDMRLILPPTGEKAWSWPRPFLTI